MLPSQRPSLPPRTVKQLLRMIPVCSNQKPKTTGEVNFLLTAQDTAFRPGNEAALRTARNNPVPWSQESKTDQQSVLRQQGHMMGIQAITDYKPPSQICHSDTGINTFHDTCPLLCMLNDCTVKNIRDTELRGTANWFLSGLNYFRHCLWHTRKKTHVLCGAARTSFLKY